MVDRSRHSRTIGQPVNRRSINDYDIEAFGEMIEERFKSRVAEEGRRAWWHWPCKHDGQLGDICLKRGFVRGAQFHEHRRKPQGRASVDELFLRGLTHVAVDQQGMFSAAREIASNSKCGSALAFALRAAGEQDRLRPGRRQKLLERRAKRVMRLH